MTIRIPSPDLQINFAFSLKQLRTLYLAKRVAETVGRLDIAELDRQLAQFALADDLSAMADMACAANFYSPRLYA